MWEHCLKGLESDPLSLHRECDWVAKYRLIEALPRPPLPLPAQPQRVAARPPVPRRGPVRGLYYRLQRHDQLDRICDDAAIAAAMSSPPQTTRARLRGEFVKKAKERRRDFTVDWVHLKLNDQAQRTVLLKDPFKSKDERVEKLIAGL